MSPQIHHRRTFKIPTGGTRKQPDPGFFRRALARIYPAHDELAIFVMIVSISVLALVHTDFREAISKFLYLIYIEQKEAFLTSEWEAAKTIASVIVCSVLLMAGIVASFALPFTRRRLDRLVPLIIFAHMIIITASHVVIVNYGGHPLYGLVPGASLLYFAGYVCALRFRFVTKFVADRQSTSREAFIAATLATASILICTFGLNWHWASCYAFAAINAVFVARIIVKSE